MVKVRYRWFSRTGGDKCRRLHPSDNLFPGPFGAPHLGTEQKISCKDKLSDACIEDLGLIPTGRNYVHHHRSGRGPGVDLSLVSPGYEGPSGRRRRAAAAARAVLPEKNKRQTAPPDPGRTPVGPVVVFIF